MHKNLPKIYYFIDNLEVDDIKKIDKSIGIIYRNYWNKCNTDLIKKINNYCKTHKKKFFLANDFKLSQKLNLSGVYLPSFNQKLIYNNTNKRKNFAIIGSAHNLKEIKIKEKQGCELIFLSSIFKNNKNSFFLGINKFNILSNLSNKKIIALGGINEFNIKKLKLTKSYGFASISYIKKNGPNKLGRF